MVKHVNDVLGDLEGHFPDYPYPYPYLGSGKIHFLIGHALGEGMAELLGLKAKAATNRK